MSEISDVKPLLAVSINIDRVVLAVNNLSPAIVTLIFLNTGPGTVSPALRSSAQAPFTSLSTQVHANYRSFLQADSTARATLKIIIFQLLC